MNSIPTLQTCPSQSSSSESRLRATKSISRSKPGIHNLLLRSYFSVSEVVSKLFGTTEMKFFSVIVKKNSLNATSTKIIEEY